MPSTTTGRVGMKTRECFWSLSSTVSAWTFTPQMRRAAFLLHSGRKYVYLLLSRECLRPRRRASHPRLTMQRRRVASSIRFQLSGYLSQRIIQHSSSHVMYDARSHRLLHPVRGNAPTTSLLWIGSASVQSTVKQMSHLVSVCSGMCRERSKSGCPHILQGRAESRSISRSSGRGCVHAQSPRFKSSSRKTYSSHALLI